MSHLGPVKIAETILGAPAASITFSSIPALYRHLHVAIVGRSTQAANATSVLLQLNGDTGSNYAWEQLFTLATGAPTATETTSDTSVTVGELVGANGPANLPAVTNAYVWDYARTTFYKTVTALGGRSGLAAGSNTLRQTSGVWQSTAAVTSVVLSSSAGNIDTGTIAILYGLP